ncbi:hypothetical protein C8R44DRAFT_724037 [Mycena epipterygia]|nr:hypothetical protein C8R44DRAFT_724037 [Mycena epipterygia]
MDAQAPKLDGDPGRKALKTAVVDSPPPASDDAGGERMEVDGGPVAPSQLPTHSTTSPGGSRGGEDEVIMLRERVARLEGERDATHKALEGAERQMKDRNEEVVEVASEMKFAIKMREAAELQVVKSEEDYKQLYKKYGEVKDDLEWHKRRYAEANHRIDDLERQLDRIDGGRPRKKSAQSSPATVPSSVEESTTSVIPMNKVSIAVAVRSAKGLFKEIISPSQLPVPVPSPLPWVTGPRGVPFQIADWNLAFNFIIHNEQWSIAHVLFAAYLGARNVKAEDRNDYERHIVENFVLPNWFWNGLCSYAGDKKLVTESHNIWNGLKRPVYGDPLTASAAWFMHYETPPLGCRWQDPYGSLSLRELRGGLLWEQIGYDRKRYEQTDHSARKKYEAVARALLTVLSVPHAYERDLAAEKMVVAGTPTLAHWPPDQTEGITDNHVLWPTTSSHFVAVYSTISVTTLKPDGPWTKSRS